MHYLAEVQKKQKTGFIGAAKAELKLLAEKRGEQSWIPILGEEVIPAEEANNLNAGALVLVDLANRQVQRIQEAGRPLVSILQNFSRQLEKSKVQVEEIEQWKDSLTYQSQELNRRLEQLQHKEEDFQRLEAQRQEINSRREAVERLQKDIERNRKELQEAWEHLQSKQRRLQEQQTQFQQATVLDKATVRQIQELLDRLSSGVAPIETVREQLNLSFEMVDTGQGILNQHWQHFEQQRLTAQQQQEEVERLSQALLNSNQEWQQAQISLEQASLELKVQTSALNSKQEYAQMLGQQLRNQEELYQQIYRLTETSAQVNISQKVDLEALQKMPLNQLQQLVQDLQRDLQKASHFVNEQEEELKFQQQTIDELQAQLSQANEHDRMNVETQLADEQDSYQWLNETLVGQRQNLRERQEILSQHQAVLRRRQGIDFGNGQEDKKIDLEPILVQIQVQRQQQTEELQKLEQQISLLSSRIQKSQEVIDHQAQEQEMKRQELQSLEQNLLSLRAKTAECWGRVNLYQEMLQPVQDSLDGLRQQLQAIASTLTQVQETGNDQLQAISQMRSSLL